MKILILPNLSYHIKQRDWAKEMEYLIGNIYDVESIEKYGYYITNGWYIPANACAKVYDIIDWKVGDKIISKRHPEFGVGIIKRVDGKYAIIDFENQRDWHTANLNMDIYEPYIDKEKEIKISPRIRWYNKGKLEEKVLWGDFNVGDKVKHKQRNELGIGTIISIEPNGLVKIKFENHPNIYYGDLRTNYYELCERDKLNRIRWYKKGKLEEKAIFSDEYSIGKRVKIKKNSGLDGHSILYSGDGYGKIIRLQNDKVWRYIIRWDNNNIGGYAASHFEFVDEDEIQQDTSSRIRWYRKGKLEEKIITNFKIFEEHKLHKNQTQLLEYIENLSRDYTFIFIDTETTGLGGFKKQQLTQISAIATTYNFKNNLFEEIDNFDKKIKLTDEIKKSRTRQELVRVLKFNKYGEKGVRYIDEKQCLLLFLDWLKTFNNPLFIIQNAIFDMNMLCGRSGIKIKYPVIDTKQILQLFVIPITEKLAETSSKYKNLLNEIGTSERDFGLISSSMSKWGPFFGINMMGYHNALTDCKITIRLFINIIEYIKENKDLNIQKYQMKRILTK